MAPDHFSTHCTVRMRARARREVRRAQNYVMPEEYKKLIMGTPISAVPNTSTCYMYARNTSWRETLTEIAGGEFSSVWVTK